MKIAIILGSIRRNRKSIHVAVYLQKLLRGIDGIDPVLLDLRDYSFPVMEERFRFLDNPPEGMAEFSQHLKSADGIIMVSPEYNGSYSGALKNTLDYFKQEYHKKPMGVVTVSDGQWGGINASHHLLLWILHVKAVASPFKLMVQNVSALFNDEGLLLNEEFSLLARDFLDEFLWLTKSISGKS